MPDSSAVTVESTDAGTSSTWLIDYTVQEVVRMYSDPGFASRVEQLFVKTT